MRGRGPVGCCHCARLRSNATDWFVRCFAGCPQRTTVSIFDLCGQRVPQRKSMSKNLDVGNLPFSATADDVRDLFEPHGAVTRAEVISDRMTGRSRGFGFVELAEGADEAIAALNGADLQGRAITVNEARPR